MSFPAVSLVTHRCAAALVFVASAALVTDAAAQVVRAQTVTIGRGTNFHRSDFSPEAMRRIVQGVNVWAWDVVPVAPGVTDLHVSARYYTDFGIRDEDYGNPFVDLDRSRFVFDLAYARYRPFDVVAITLGRQWVPSALGVRDIDGVRVRLAPELGRGLRGHADLWLGADVSTRWAASSPDNWDVQGLPIDDLARPPGGARYGTSLGLGWDEASAELAWQRSHRVTEAGVVTGDERIGAALRGNVSRRLTLVSAASYHTLLEAVDRASIEMSWRAPWSDAVVSGGVEHRQPWFDSSSIFNVFGARPFDEARLVVQVPVSRLSTSFDVRTWGRAYDGDLTLSNFGAAPEDSRSVGGALGHETRFRAFGRTFQWRTFGSHQRSPDGSQGGAQWLGDVRFRFAAFPDTLYLTGRFLGLAYESGATSSRSARGTAATGAFIAELPVTFGTFTLSVDGTRSTTFDPRVGAWASFTTDLWL